MKHVLWTAALGLTIGLMGCTENKEPQKPPTATSTPPSAMHAGPPAHTAAKPDEKQPEVPGDKPEEAPPSEDKPAEPADKPEGDKPDETKPE